MIVVDRNSTDSTVFNGPKTIRHSSLRQMLDLTQHPWQTLSKGHQLNFDACTLHATTDHRELLG